MQYPFSGSLYEFKLYFVPTSREKKRERERERKKVYINDRRDAY